MKLRLLFDGEIIELSESTSIPLNKTYESLDNPTDVISEYSKSINIPMTANNNRVLVNAYRLDKVMATGLKDERGPLGLYLDPTKKIPMKLLYNSSIVMEGYAKFVSSNHTSPGSYTFVLYGMLGDIFYKLKNIVLNEDQLPDDLKNSEDKDKYILKDRCDVNPKYLDRNFVIESFNNSIPNIYGYYYDKPTDTFVGTVKTSDVIGFAPTYRGKYNEFSNSKIQTSNGEIMSLDDHLKNKWINTYKSQNPNATQDTAEKYVDNLNPSELVKDGLFDYEMREYRSYMLKPYIYFNQLMQMFMDQCKIVSDYEIMLDVNWFSVNNPYWTRLCYALDYLDSETTENTKEEITIKKELTRTGSSTTSYYKTLTQTVSSQYVNGSSILELDSFYVDVTFTGERPTNPLADNNMKINFIDGTYITIEILASPSSSDPIIIYASDKDFSYMQQYIQNDRFKEENYIKLTGNMCTWDGDTYSLKYRIPIKKSVFSKTNGAGVRFTSRVTLRRDITTDEDIPFYVLYYKGYNRKWVYLSDLLSGTSHKIKCEINPLVTIKKWRDSIRIDLQTLYKKEDGCLFDIILQYTKMFGLVWEIDYNTKQLHVKHKSTYFKDYTITDWNHKVDKSKDFIVEPITFGSRFISFNYEDVDGGLYGAYKDKYRINYGEKKLTTGYDFNYEIHNLFEGISPTIVSSKTYTPYKNIYDYNFTGLIPLQTDDRAILDYQDKDSSISIYNWFLRNENKNVATNSIWITDDTPYQIEFGEYCWIDQTNWSLINNYGVSPTTIPVFNVVMESSELFPFEIGKTLGCLFNTPTEDYTSDNSVSKMLGNSIYDLFWSGYIKDRYNIQNKKVTAYFRISPDEYQRLKFNNFVVIDNQLYMINKIMDYNLSENNKPTKIELIQITDTSSYSESVYKFEPYMLIQQPVTQAMKSLWYTTKSASIKVLATVSDYYCRGPERGEFTDLKGQVLQHPAGDDMGYFNITTSTVWNPNTGRDIITISFDENLKGYEFVGSIKYEFTGGEIEIPIVCDWT